MIYAVTEAAKGGNAIEILAQGATTTNVLFGEQCIYHLNITHTYLHVYTRIHVHLHCRCTNVHVHVYVPIMLKYTHVCYIISCSTQFNDILIYSSSIPPTNTTFKVHMCIHVYTLYIYMYVYCNNLPTNY